MKRSPIVLLMILVVFPLALLAWAGVRLSQHQTWQAQQRIRQLLTGQLGDDDRTIAESFRTLAAELQELTAIDTYEIESLRDIVRSDPRLFQIFVIDPEDVLIHPNPDGPLLQSERDFILRAAQIFNDRELQQLVVRAAQSGLPAEASGKPENPDRPVPSTSRTPKVSPITRESSGWFTWYWGPGLNLMYWQRRRSGHIVGVALERARWIADVIASLPDTPSLSETNGPPATRLRIRLVESGGETIYEWGQFSPPEADLPAGQIRLSEPLEAWQLQIFAPLAVLTESAGGGAYWNLLAGLLITGVALTALAVVFYQQYARDMREAGERVSFVNQVSHELRTPLTNIRMYAELVDTDLDKLKEPTAESRRRIDVIIAESGRLSRLIDNVLTFARQQRDSQSLSRQRCVTDEVIRKVLSRFQVSLIQQGIVTEVDLQTAEESLVDPDAVEQILGNLISNVEKYAATGKWMRITSRQQNGETVITVSDRGPGIPAAHRLRVFEPYWRASHGLNQSAGTGIGLAIAKHMARLHGGDLTVQSTDEGTTFEVQLTTPPPTGEKP